LVSVTKVVKKEIEPTVAGELLFALNVVVCQAKGEEQRANGEKETRRQREVGMA
jgi:hypothetical protein